MPTTKADLIHISKALEACSGGVTLLKDGAPVVVNFRFSGKTRLAIADSLIELEPQVKAIEKASKEIVKQHGGPWEKTCPEEQACRAELAAIEAQETIAPEFTLPLAEFEKDDNPVPAAIIKTLRPYLQ